MPIPKRPQQPRLLHPEPIAERNPPAHESSRILYKCRCGNKLELHIQAEAVQCVRCGCRMKQLGEVS